MVEVQVIKKTDLFGSQYWAVYFNDQDGNMIDLKCFFDGIECKEFIASVKDKLQMPTQEVVEEFSINKVEEKKPF